VPSSPAAPSKSTGANPYLLLTLPPFFWSCNWIIGRGVAPEIPPMAMTFFRWLRAILVFATPIMWPGLRLS